MLYVIFIVWNGLLKQVDISAAKIIQLTNKKTQMLIIIKSGYKKRVIDRYID